MSKERLQHPRLRGSDILRLAGTGLRARPMRAFLSALGIAIGIAAMIAVVGISTSSRAQLTAQLESLGTNMLTVTPGADFSGTNIKSRLTTSRLTPVRNREESARARTTTIRAIVA